VTTIDAHRCGVCALYVNGWCYCSASRWFRSWRDPDHMCEHWKPEAVTAPPPEPEEGDCTDCSSCDSRCADIKIEGSAR
jgi:hypothetical protein